MKRSEINEFIADAVAFFDSHGYHLPPFAHWSPDDWQTKGPKADEIHRSRLGWDLTDFGSGDFLDVGLLLFTVRNGNLADPDNPKTYAEKAMIVREGQVTPWHFHGGKMEDIINRGGGDLVIDLCNSGPKGEFIDTPVTVSTDGVQRTVEPKGTVILTPGESITLTRGLAHQFYGEKGKGKVFVGEVSSVNDDETDNFFIPPVGRFPEIEEDVPPTHHLCTEYP
jgi:D-lyxose ketol-isomerase